MAKKQRGERRKRGTGTIQKQRDGTFIARTAGKERSGRFPAGPAGYEEAERALDQWNKQLGQGVDPNDSRMKFRDFIRAWLIEVVKPHRRPRTFEFYARHAGYATAICGDTAVEALGTRQLEKVLAQLRLDGLSPRSVDHVRAVLVNALNVAGPKRWKLIDDNPAAAIPKIKVPEQEEKALTAAQVAVLLRAIETDRLCALYHVALTLGLRRGELLGLRWSDIDWTAGTITVAQQVGEGEGRKIGIQPYTKSDEGLRVLPVGADTLARLRMRQAEDAIEAQLAQQRATKKAEKEGVPTPLVVWNPDDLVFCSDVGTFIQPSNFNRRFAALIERTNKQTRARAQAEGWKKDELQALLLPVETSPHTLRHTALTDLAAHGEAKAVQSIAGHADIETTMNLYAGRHAGAMRAAVEAVEKARKTS